MTQLLRELGNYDSYVIASTIGISMGNGSRVNWAKTIIKWECYE